MKCRERDKSGHSSLIALYPGHIGGEKQPGINCLHMRGRFHYISIKL